MRRLPFSEMVERRMREKGLSLRAVCREARLDASFFSKVLSGKRSPPSEEPVIRKLASVLGFDPIELIVSTGRIPSEWQPLFKDPSVLNTLSRMASPQRLHQQVPPPRTMGERGPTAQPFYAKTDRPLSDDLL